MDPHPKYFDIEASGAKTRQLVFEMLYRFNKETMEELLGCQEFIDIIIKPLNKLNMIDLLMKNREDEIIKQVYIKQLEMHKNICISESALIPKILLNYLS